MNLRSLLLAFSAAATLSAAAQQRTSPQDLTFAENIETPKPANKGIGDIRAHMHSLQASLVKKGLATDLERDDEVLVITIPCSDLFQPNEVALKQAAAAKLSPLISFAKYPTMYKVLVAVYADDTGSNAYADSLTSARASAVCDYLTSIPAQTTFNVVTYGLGNADPIESNDSMKGRAANRRIEIYVVPEWQMLDMAKSGKLKQ